VADAVAVAVGRGVAVAVAVTVAVAVAIGVLVAVAVAVAVAAGEPAVVSGVQLVGRLLYLCCFYRFCLEPITANVASNSSPLKGLGR
jgi:hypothetical protein